MSKKILPPAKVKSTPRNASVKKKIAVPGKNKKGQPSTDALVKLFGIEKLYSMIAGGIPYETIAEHVPVRRPALMYWLASHEQMSEYTRAREERANFLAEECIAIADQEPGVNEHGMTDTGAVAHQRLRVDTRRWITSKMLPTVYGDRQILAGDPNAPLQMKHTADLSNLTDEELVLLEKLTSKISESKE